MELPPEDPPFPDANLPSAKEKVKFPDDDYDWELDSDDKEDDEHSTVRIIFDEFQSAFLIHLLDSGVPAKEKGLLFFLLIQLHEHLYSPLYVYSVIPSVVMWYYPFLRPQFMFNIIKAIDNWKQSEYGRSRDTITLALAQIAASTFLRYTIDFQGTVDLIEPIFGPVERWTATLLPIVPGIFFRSINERPNEINGFVPENKMGIIMAVFISACTAVLPRMVQWGLFAAYAIPSYEYPTMVVDFVICTFSWIFLDVTPMAGYAMWLLVNQYRHPKTWFRLSGGGPSVVLERQRRGTMCYITTIILIRSFDLAMSEHIMDNEAWSIRPRDWIPLAIVVIAGFSLLKYGVLLRIYRYEHKQLQGTKSMRLLRVRAQPCLPNTPIQCDMIHTSLLNPPQYSAISHRWDSVESSKEFILIEGGLFQVSRSIYTLLMAKRSNIHHVYVWIDSACIDQKNAEEKSRQVGLMRNIFEEAEMVLGWLGENPDAQKAFALIHRINDMTADSAYLDLRSEPDAGWTELQGLMASEWFERVWIIQELAVSKASVLRYDNQYIGWSEVSKALYRVIALEFRLQKSPATVLDLEKILNTLIMEEARHHVASLDLIKLREMLKLTFGFKATLPIDRVYALLGLVDERHTPLFHPRFGASDSNVRVVDPRTGVKDIGRTLSLLAQILDAIKGRSKSRRAKAIVAAGTTTTLRYLEMLSRDLETAAAKLEQMSTSFEELEEERMQPDYTSKSTAHLVYTHVARDLVKQDDTLFFICYAGTALPKHPELKGLPSWVPDWSQDISTYVLPWCKYDEPKSSVDETESSNHLRPVFKLDGPESLLVQGYHIGTVSHAVGITHGCDPNYINTLERAILDSEQLHSKLKTAFNIAKAELRTHYPDVESLKQDFYSTLATGCRTDDQKATLNMREWIRILGLMNAYAIATQTPSNGSRGSTSTDPTAFTNIDLPAAVSGYVEVRRRSTSTASKLAHLIRVDVIPSFSQYRRGKPSTSSNGMPSILDDANSGPLAAYAQYADYTIGRSFIIVDSKIMGLSPSATEVGDIVVEVRSKGRIVCLTLREVLEEVLDITTKTTSEEPSNPENLQFPIKTYQLVGEAYVHRGTLEAPPVSHLQWFKLK